MRELVRDQRDQRSVTRNDRRRGKGQPRIFHPSEREAGGENENVVPPPLIGTVQRLRRLDHLRCVGKLPCGPVDHLRLGIDSASGSDLTKLQIADRKREQVRRNRLRHPEMVDAGIVRLGRILGAHHGHQTVRYTDSRLVRHPHARGVLNRDPGAGEDRLGLGEQERILPARRLLGGEPLQCRCFGARPISDRDRLCPGTDSDHERATEIRIRFAEIPVSFDSAV